MKKFATLMLGIVAVAYAAWMIVYPSATWRYRLTLQVETPEGLKTGSSVIEVQVKDGPSFNPEGARNVFVRGEAVAVDLGARGVLFALLSSERSADHAQHVVYETFPWPGGPGGQVTKAGRAFYQALEGRAELPIERLPLLVRFRDINDPKSVEMVNPTDLAASFGPGVKLGKATIEMTKDRVTTGIVQRLTWLIGPKGGGYLDGRFSGGGPELANILHGGDFEKDQ